MTASAPDLLVAVRAKLEADRGHWPLVSRTSGVPYFTIVKLAQGQTINPRWQTLRALALHYDLMREQDCCQCASAPA